VQRIDVRKADMITQRHLDDFVFGGEVKRDNWHILIGFEQLRGRCCQDSPIETFPCPSNG